MTNDSGSSAPICSEESDASTSVDTAFELLARERRRAVLYCLGTSDGSIPLSELTARVAKREAADSVADDVRQEIAISLSQVHLPKLADADVVEYDHGKQQVEYRGDPFVETILDQAAGIEQSR